MTAVIQTTRRHDTTQQHHYRQYRRGAHPHPVYVRAEPDYAVRRVVAVLLAALLLAVAVIVVSAAVDVGGRPAAASDIGSADTASARAHVAQPGDTLWSIADRYRGEVGRSRFVDALIDLNGGTVIQVGQAVLLP